MTLERKLAFLQIALEDTVNGSLFGHQLYLDNLSPDRRRLRIALLFLVCFFGEIEVKPLFFLFSCTSNCRQNTAESVVLDDVALLQRFTAQGTLFAALLANDLIKTVFAV